MLECQKSRKLPKSHRLRSWTPEGNKSSESVRANRSPYELSAGVCVHRDAYKKPNLNSTVLGSHA